eukprot:TRINITY_DN2700_c0_g1_i1.p1 TRINITY_DN2700_c0_g1~~TRINITY_DN2700_c0_g1_i1.p1  ORF type:complete len:291 (-),score=23.78 TRINITY_DN2700_c0_g1_i1:221-1093(-)
MVRIPNMFIIPSLVSLLLLLNLQICYSQANTSSGHNNNTAFHTAKVLKVFRHDPQAFTEGLQYGGNDTLFESTGLYGRSSIREWNLQSGMVKQKHEINRLDFGEGLALLNQRLFQLTWKTNSGYIYERSNLGQVGTFHHPMKDGWGLTTDGKGLFGSDGSSRLYYLDAVTFKEKHHVHVKYEGKEVRNLNELEFVKGEIWANVWQSDCIVRVSPKDGKVLGWVFLHNLRSNLVRAGYSIDVLNGIAWDAEKDRLFVTGKLWPELYQIKLQNLTQHAARSLGNISQICQLQ